MNKLPAISKMMDILKKSSNLNLQPVTVFPSESPSLQAIDRSQRILHYRAINHLVEQIEEASAELLQKKDGGRDGKPSQNKNAIGNQDSDADSEPNFDFRALMVR